MIALPRIPILVLLIVSIGPLCRPASGAVDWAELPPLPDRLGVAGAFAGVHGGALLVAGGANFPGKPPWDNGAKAWHDAVYVLEQAAGPWRVAGRLPRPLGYGVSVSTTEGIICIGGSDSQRHHANVFLLRWEKGEVKTEPLPGLPKPCANACGALLGNTVYVAGGIETPGSTAAMKTFWALDLASPQRKWRELEPWPGPARMLAVAAAQGRLFFLASGAELSPDAQGKPVRRYLNDAYRYEPGCGWRRLADMPRPAVAAPTPAPALGGSRFAVLGGDDGSLVGFRPAERHPGFLRSGLVYDVQNDVWKSMGEMPFGHVTTATACWNGRTIVPSGEVRPGVRSPKVWAARLTP